MAIVVILAAVRGGSGSSGGPGDNWPNTPWQWTVFVLLCIAAVATVVLMVYAFVTYEPPAEHPKHAPSPSVSASAMRH